MRVSVRLIVPLLAGGLFATAITCSSAQAELRQRERAAVAQQVLPAWWRGDSVSVVAALSTIVGRLNDNEINQLDELLAAYQLPDVQRILLEVRLGMVESGGIEHLPAPQQWERQLVLNAVRQEISDLRRTIDSHSALDDSGVLGLSLPDYEPLLSELKVLHARLRGGAALARYAQSLADLPQKRAAEDESQLDASYFLAAAAEFDVVAESIIDLAKTHRRDRLVLASQILQQSQDFAERIRAAWAVQIDGEFLTGAAETDARRDEIAQIVEQARESGGEALLEKSRLLYSGLQWWLRGRYGRAPLGGGMLKPPQVLRNPKLQMAVMMPYDIPKPTSPTSMEGSVPDYPRRHHFVWQWEYRRLNPTFTRMQQTTLFEGSRITLDVPRVEEFYCPKRYIRVTDEVVYGVQTVENVCSTYSDVTDNNDDMAYQIMGLVEYAAALSQLDQLAAMTSDDEWAAIDEIVAQHDEYSVFVNLSRLVPHSNSQLDEPPAALPDGERRRGLAYVMAVARVELGAMLAAFTRSPQPFPQAAPKARDAQAYAELLFDGVRTHFWALQNENPMERTVNNFSGLMRALANARRMRMVRAMLAAVAPTAAQQLNPIQLAELQQWNKRLTELHEIILARIEIAIAPPRVVRTVQQNEVMPTERQRRIAEEEISAGRVTITPVREIRRSSSIRPPGSLGSPSSE